MSHHTMPLVINSLRGGHTWKRTSVHMHAHTHTRINLALVFVIVSLCTVVKLENY